MDSKVRNRNLCLNHGKTFPIPIKFYQSSSFYIPYRMPMKKTPNKSRTEKRASGNSPLRGFRRGLGRAASRAGALVRLLRGSNPKTRIFIPIPQIRPFPTKIMFIQLPYPSITSYNINFTRLMTLIIKHPNNPFDIQIHKLASYIDSNRCIVSLTIQ